ncbi:MAG: type VI secretion system baseplate subunit TssF [Polyangiaceae bacterium]|jgi:type VI secretion system protein ImpG
MFNKYFQDELAYLRELGREFSQAYPTLAPMLADRGVDPDVERLLEGVAFLTGRIRQKLDDEIPEFLQSLGALLFPHLMRALPAASILEITPVANALRESHLVKAGTEFASVPVDGQPCTFRSSTDCLLSPVAIEDVRLEMLPGARQQLSITLRSISGSPLVNVLPPTLRFHFCGEPHIAFALLFAVNRQLADVTLSPVAGAKGAGGKELSLGTKVLRWVGFEEDEGLLPLGRHVFPGFRLLEEYYVMPSKFAFVDISDVRRVAELDKEATKVTLAFRFDRAFPPTTRVNQQNVKLHCVPIVNVYESTSEPIRLVPSRERFVVRPAGLPPSHGEVYAITHVQAILRGSTNRVSIPAFYEFSHASASEHGFYATYLTPSVTGDGADMLISFGSPEGSGKMIDAETISIDLLGTNRSVAAALRPGDVSVHTASSPAFVTFSNITAMTPHVPPPLGRELQWRAVAHAAIGLRALTEPEVLRAVIDVYNLHAMVDRQAARANELRVGGIKDVRVRPEERLYRGAAVRGVAIDVDLDEDGFAGDGDLFLFSAVLDRMFGEHMSINSFAHTTFRTLRSKLELRWPPRSGNLMLL